MSRARCGAVALAALVLGCHQLGELLGQRILESRRSAAASDGDRSDPAEAGEDARADEPPPTDWDRVVDAYRSATGQDVDGAADAKPAPPTAPGAGPPRSRAPRQRAPTKAAALYVNGAGEVVRVGSVDEVPERFRGSMIVLGNQLPSDTGGVSVVNESARRSELDRATAAWQRRAVAEERRAPPIRRRGRGRVVVFQTSWCPACTAARQYLDREGIAYTTRDVEKDAAARKEFRRHGGSSVPLLLVNGTPIRGFDPAAIRRALR